jgi:nitrous oxide reductase accessory protein NosL
MELAMRRSGTVAFPACLAALSAIGLAACSPGPATGPGEMHWDRDTCERCQMAIGDRSSAAQIRDARDLEPHKFDDLGCALLWQDERRPEEEERPEIWVRDPGGERWLDGYGARYVGGRSTPMGYGFGAASERSQAGMGLAEVWERIRAVEHERRSKGR